MLKLIGKNLFSLILPFTVLVIVPRSIEQQWEIANSIKVVAGSVLGLTGLSMMGITIASFITIGKGTLAPWSPTRKLVVAGLYRFVRNPMILGVMLVLLAEAFIFWSTPIFKWSILFYFINTIYFILYEEPNLESRFGEEYKVYKKHVNRWWPRFTPYQPEEA